MKEPINMMEIKDDIKTIGKLCIFYVIFAFLANEENINYFFVKIDGTENKGLLSLIISWNLTYSFIVSSIIVLPLFLPIIFIFKYTPIIHSNKPKLKKITNIILITVLFCLYYLYIFFRKDLINIENNILYVVIIFMTIICLSYKNEAVNYSFPVFLIFFLIVSQMNREAGSLILMLFFSFILILFSNSIFGGNINNTINLHTVAFIIKEKYDIVYELLKIKNKSIKKEVSILILLIISGGFFFTNKTMMISDNILMHKIIQEPICNKCETGMYFIEDKDIKQSSTINNVLQYALLNNLIDFSNEKKKKKEKYVIKKYNIPDYYISLNSIVYVIGTITSIDNAQTKNYTHNNIITEYIILLYSVIGKILMSIIAYKIFLIRNEDEKAEVVSSK